MSLEIEVGGVRYAGFTSAAVEARMDAACRSFSFEATSSEGKPFPFKGGEACRVLADGELYATGWLEIVDASGDSADHEISLKGRDLVADLVDSTLGVLADIRAPIGLATIARRVLSHLDSGVKVVDLASPERFNEAEDMAAPEPGKPVFEFLEALARKRQVLLNSNAEGNLVIARPSGGRSGATLLHRVESDENNVLSWSVSYDSTGRFRRYQSLSQLNVVPTLFAAGVDLASIVSQGEGRVVTDRGVRRGRQMVVASESAYSAAEGDKRARWEASFRRARARVYSASVDGFRDFKGRLWTPNVLVRVLDEFAGIDADMMVNGVKFEFTPEGGSVATLALVEKDAYTLDLADPKNQELGLGLVSEDSGEADSGVAGEEE